MKIEEIYNKDYSFVDVRSPKEFEEDTIPGAINIPLFENEERAIVGTIYTKQSKEEAVKKGFQIVEPKLKEIESKLKQLKQPIIIFCWRGGMRSGSIVSHFKELNLKKLEGGYKAYRAYVREQLKIITLPKSLVLYGLTGSGKTDLIQPLKNCIDLEGLAQHRGSILGDIAKTPSSQKKFESLLLKRILETQNEPFIILECESRKIGKITLPEVIFKKIKQPWKTVLLDKSIDERVKILKATYCEQAPKKEIIRKLKLIEKHLGKTTLNELIQYIEQDDLDQAIKIILEKYYDIHYQKLFHDFNHTVKSDKEFLDLLTRLKL